MTPTEFRSELRKLSHGYLFCGEEAYLKHHYLNSVRSALVEEGDVFNHIRLNEESYTLERLVAAIEALPMMAEKKLIEVSGLSFFDRNESELEELISALSLLPAYEYNVLVLSVEPDELDIGTEKQPNKIFSRLCEYLKPVVFRRETPARLASWTVKHFAADQIVAPPDAVNALLDRCGCDMYTLSSEIEKLICYLKEKGRERLTPVDVFLVCSEAKEIAAFDFANAILDRQPERAFAILCELKRRKEKPEIILSGISRVIADLSIVKTLGDSGMTPATISSRLKAHGVIMHEYRVKLYLRSAERTSASSLKALLERCYEADMTVKSTGVDSYAVLDRLAAETAGRI